MMMAASKEWHKLRSTNKSKSQNRKERNKLLFEDERYGNGAGVRAGGALARMTYLAQIAKQSWE